MPRGRKKKRETRNLNIIVTTLTFVNFAWSIDLFKRRKFGKEFKPCTWRSTWSN